MNARAIALTLVLCMSGVAVSLAQNPNIGTWKLNERKSKFAPGVTKNHTVVYEDAGEDVKVTTDGTDKDGKPTHSEGTGKLDGKDYPVTGDPNSDARSVTKIDDRHLDFDVKNRGVVTTVGHVIVSTDGRSRTVRTTSSDATGKKASSTAVYDKQ